MPDNRAAWTEVFVLFPNFTVLHDFVRFYLALEASSCELERNLSRVRRLLDSHGATPQNSEDLETSLEIMLFGPSSEEDLFSKVSSPNLDLQISKKIKALCPRSFGFGCPKTNFNFSSFILDF